MSKSKLVPSCEVPVTFKVPHWRLMFIKWVETWPPCTSDWSSTWWPTVWRFGSHVIAIIFMQLTLLTVVAGVQRMQDTITTG